MQPEPDVSSDVDSDTLTALAASVASKLYLAPVIVNPSATTCTEPPYCEPVNSKLLLALLSVVLPIAVIVVAPPDDAVTKFPFEVLDPVCTSVEPLTVRSSDPPAPPTLKLLTGDVSDELPQTITVAAGGPPNTMFPADVEDKLVLVLNVIVIEITATPKRTFSFAVVMLTPDVEIVLVPVAGPAIENPNPDDVIVDDTIVTLVFVIEPAHKKFPAVALRTLDEAIVIEMGTRDSSATYTLLPSAKSAAPAAEIETDALGASVPSRIKLLPALVIVTLLPMINEKTPSIEDATTILAFDAAKLPVCVSVDEPVTVSARPHPVVPEKYCCSMLETVEVRDAAPLIVTVEDCGVAEKRTLLPDPDVRLLPPLTVTSIEAMPGPTRMFVNDVSIVVESTIIEVVFHPPISDTPNPPDVTLDPPLMEIADMPPPADASMLPAPAEMVELDKKLIASPCTRFMK